MKTPANSQMLFFLLSILLIYVMGPFPAEAQWGSDPGENVMISGAAKDQREPAVVSDGAGSVIICWRDYRYTASIFGGEIFVQKIDSAGMIRWTEDGLQVNASALNKGHFRPLMTEDQDSGAIIVWNRGPLNFYNYDIFAQRLNGSGEKIWPLNDVTISDTAGTESFHKVVSDHAGGALITWSYLPGTPGTTDIYAQRVDANGNILWKKNGVAVCTAGESQSNPALAWDGYGGAIIVWEDSRAGIGTVNIFAQRIDAEGNIQWQTDGLEICDFQDKLQVCDIVGDGAGGAVIVFSQQGNPPGLYAQRINDSGDRQWGNNGVKISSTFADQTMCDAVPGEDGGVMVTWQESRGQDYDIFAQHFTAEGLALWDENGTPVSVGIGDQMNPVAVVDGTGGLIITWQDRRTDSWGDLYAQRLNSLGIPLWQINGIAITTATGEQSMPVIASDGDAGAIFVWQDKRNGNDYDIYAQRVDKNGHFGELTDQDNDGIADSLEQGPQGTDPDYDGNGDQIPDWQQDHVASFHTYDQQHYVTLAVPDSVLLENVGAIDNPNPDAPGIPSGSNAPFGFFSFTITGLTEGSYTVATLFLENDPSFNTYYKYGPTPGEQAHWYEFGFDGETGAMINADTVFLYLTDGKRGDYDLSANGVIVEPGGPLQISTYVGDQGKDAFYLEQNHPNPVIHSTDIVFGIPEFTHVRLEVFDISGKLMQCLLNKRLLAGKHTLVWQTSKIPQGIYILKLTAGNKSLTRKMLILN